MRNCISVDVEDWFQPMFVAEKIPLREWEKQESIMVDSCDRILEIFTLKRTRATFFVTGWIAEKYPDTIRKIYNEGHEIAAHGYYHKCIAEQTRDEFKEDLTRCKKFVEKSIGEKIVGYRAPFFSINKDTAWAFKIIKETGFRYDSSIYPMAFRSLEGAARFGNYEVIEGLAEVPLSVLQISGINIPAAGGFFTRLYPVSMLKGMIRRINMKGLPYVTYFHNWEVATEYPRLNLGVAKSFVQYYNLRSVEKKINAILGEFKFTTAADMLESS
jgi:polysaccharide deacetylase family protein (PEP-CTERM system associated)